MRRLRQWVRTAWWLLRGQIRRGPGAFFRAVGRIGLRAMGRTDALDPYRPILRPPPLLFGRRAAGADWRDQTAEWYEEEASKVDAKIADLGDRIEILTDRATRLRGQAGQQRILEGRWAPELPSREIEPVPGTVLHLVGKSLPHSLAGYTVRTHEVVRAQLEVGIPALVATRIGFPWDVDATPASPVEIVDGVPYHRLGGGIPDVPPDEAMTRNVELLAELVEATRPAILHAHSDFHNALLGAAVADMFGLPLIYEVRGFWEETWLSKSRERDTDAREYRNRRARELDAIRRADHVITLVETMRDRMVADGVSMDAITIVPNAVDPGLFPRRVGRNHDITRTLGIPDDEPVIGYITSLVGYEGVENLVSATARLRRRGVPVHCLIVGDGDQRERLERQATHSPAGPFIHFTGRIPHDRAPEYYQAIDVFVIPRRDESVTRLVQPLKPYEALSTGIPLVVSDLPALRTIVEHSGAGRTFAPGKPQDLAAVIEDLLRDPVGLAEMGERGAEHVRREHTWHRNAQRYLDVYQRFGSP